jgi:CheY-specific phosphatase CheX
MIFGQAKTVLNDKFGYGIHPALPTILSGHALNVFFGRTGPSICLPFTFQGGNFQIEISSEKTN